MATYPCQNHRQKSSRRKKPTSAINRHRLDDVPHGSDKRQASRLKFRLKPKVTYFLGSSGLIPSKSIFTRLTKASQPPDRLMSAVALVEAPGVCPRIAASIANVDHEALPGPAHRALGDSHRCRTVFMGLIDPAFKIYPRPGADRQPALDIIVWLGQLVWLIEEPILMRK